MESSKKEILLITGITGYIGSMVAKVILDKASSQYKIRASVRDMSKTK
jgi:GDP-D-mannose dehydratase